MIAFTAATVLVAIGVTSMLLGMRSRLAIDTEFQAGSETQISVVAAAAAPEADTTALDTPIPFMATATCPAVPAPRFGAGDTRPEPVDSTFAVSFIKTSATHRDERSDDPRADHRGPQERRAPQHATGVVSRT